MTYTSPELLLIITAIGGIIINIISAWKTEKNVQTTLKKAEVIEHQVNSKEVNYVEQIASNCKEINILKSIIIDKEKMEALLAQSQTQSKFEDKEIK